LATFLEGSKSYIYSRSFTSSANLAKIVPADVEIIGLKGIVKK